MKQTITNRCIFLIIIHYFVHIAVCEKFLFEDPEKLFGITERITALKTYAPSENYCWQLEWKVGKQTYSGRLTGKVEGSHHWINIIFPDQATLFFDKNNPQQAFYPHRLCLLPQERWQEPLGGLPSVSYELIAMPFLNDTVISVKKTAKQGRKALEVDLKRKNHIFTKVFLDLKFNTILEIQHLSAHPISKFKLKSLKKFNGIWGLHQAEFSQGKTATKLKITSIKYF